MKAIKKRYIFIFLSITLAVSGTLFANSTTSFTSLPITDYTFTSPNPSSSDPKRTLKTNTTVTSLSQTCYNIINALCKSTVQSITASQQSSYKTALASLPGNLLGITLNDADTLIYTTYQYWYDYIVNTSFITSASSSSTPYASALQNMQDKYNLTSSSDSSLQAQMTDLQSQIDDLNASITQLTTDQTTAVTTLETNRLTAYQTFMTSDLALRGRLGTVTNNSSISYQLIAGDGSILDTILSGQTSSRVYVLSDYANDQQGSMFKLVPYDAVNQIQEDTAEGMLSGGTIVILANSIGVNSPGNPYGYADSVSITRVYPEDATRAHVVDLTTLVADNQYWQADFKINPLISVDNGDGTTTEVIYPFISAIETSAQGTDNGWDVTLDFPSAAEAVMDTKIAITQSNSSANSYPAFDSEDAASDWSDLPQ
jgi:hypothetical protein